VAEVTALTTILNAVDRAKQVKPSQWMSACPCCRSRKGRPLAITEAGDRVLLHAFCGCTTESVLGALGLTVTDLFDTPREHRQEPMRARVSARDVLASVSQEVTFVAIIAAYMLEHKTITESDWERLSRASTRIAAARDQIG
jgi:hypothetical protein